MSDADKPLSFNILDKEYLIACEDHERDILHRAVELLNVKMRDVKSSGKVIGSERIAVMTALHLAHELLEYKEENESYTNQVDNLVRRLQNKIDDALTQGKQMEMQ
ncbi:MAG TPA: cell division protein ZapA [Gammaproteobacteria bacterium]|nr:cell division protein ZapA [Gammaproteobacteria bacterium]